MLKHVIRPAFVSAVVLSATVSSLPAAYAAAPKPDDVPALSTPLSSFKDFSDVSDYAKKAVVKIELLGLFPNNERFKPQDYADIAFAKNILGTLDSLGHIKGNITYSDAHQLVSRYVLHANASTIVSVDGFLSKKGYQQDDYISREDFAYIVSHARELDITNKGTPIHNPAIATPGPLLGPTVFQSGIENGVPVFDGSTVSLFHRAKNAFNTTFNDDNAFTLQVHPEVFKSVSAGGIAVNTLQDLSAQLEVELSDGTIHRTPLISLTPFSIHGADGKAGVIRIEDGLLVLVDDLLGYVDNFKLNGHAFSVQKTVQRLKQQAYQNGDKTSSLVASAVSNDLLKKGFSLQDRRLMAHNMILTKTALQQGGLSPLGAPFNTIAGPSSNARGFENSYLYKLYALIQGLRDTSKSGGERAIRESLSQQDTQESLLTGTKILTATTLLPHISALSNAPFLPNEALSSRVKKAGALLPSEPISFQFDRLKRASYIIMDDALSGGNASHLVTTGDIVRSDKSKSSAFELRASNFSAIPLNIKDSVVSDALVDYSEAYEALIHLISGVHFSGALTDLDHKTLNALNTAFSRPVLSDEMSEVKIGGLDFKIDMLGTPSHIQENFTPANALTQSRQAESFGLSTAQNPFPTRLAEYICNGDIVSNAGAFIAKSKLDPAEQIDLIADFSGESEECISAVNDARYHQLLFVDNFQLPPFGPKAKFISSQGIEIINRVLLTPQDADQDIADIRLSYRLIESQTNKAPIAAVSGLNKVKKGIPFILDASNSSDADGDTLIYQWKVISGEADISQSRTDSKAIILAKSKGPLVIELQVNDGIANSKIIQKRIHVNNGYSGVGSTGFYFLSLLGLIYFVRRINLFKSKK